LRQLLGLQYWQHRARHVTDAESVRHDGARWRAFEDRCPHRLAPLSEGRVEADGTLLCAYHAWRFDGGGACTAGAVTT
jgi:nitrite reductase/ring-hydroxylating ferredoxin subunit